MEKSLRLPVISVIAIRSDFKYDCSIEKMTDDGDKHLETVFGFLCVTYEE